MVSLRVHSNIRRNAESVNKGFLVSMGFQTPILHKKILALRKWAKPPSVDVLAERGYGT